MYFSYMYSPNTTVSIYSFQMLCSLCLTYDSSHLQRSKKLAGRTVVAFDSKKPKCKAIQLIILLLFRCSIYGLCPSYNDCFAFNLNVLCMLAMRFLSICRNTAKRAYPIRSQTVTEFRKHSYLSNY